MMPETMAQAEAAAPNESLHRSFARRPYVDPYCYPSSVPRGSGWASTVPFYILAHILNVCLGVALVALILVGYSQRLVASWVRPLITPVVFAAIPSAFNAIHAHTYRRRSHPYVRILSGCLLGAALAVAAGLSTKWSVEGTPEMSYSFSGPIMALLYIMVAIELGMALDAVHQLVRMHRYARQVGV